MRGLGILTAALLLAGAHAGPEWTPSTFPNPKVDITQCGRGVASSICDPDGVVTRAEADRIEGAIKDIHAGTDPYIRKKCGDDLEGFMVGVALMRSMAVPEGSDPGTEAARFARSLHDGWGVGNPACGNGLVILLAVEQRQVYISTGKAARDALSDGHVKAIVAAARARLRAGDFGGAVLQMTVDVGLGLAGGPMPGNDDGDDAGWVAGGVLAVIAGAFGLSAWKNRRRASQLRDCKRRLDKIKHEQEQLRRHEWSRPASCPICLEDFEQPPMDSREGGGNDADAGPSTAVAPAPSAPLLPSATGQTNASTGPAAHAGAPKKPITLRCGHTFCEPCLDQWLSGHDNCPICRKDMEGEPARAPSGKTATAAAGQEADDARRVAVQQIMDTDLTFRLLMLQRMYPWYLTDSMIARWADEAHNRGTFDWAGTREFQLHDAAAARHQAEAGHGGFATSFGGGSSFGGGGGGGSW